MPGDQPRVSATRRARHQGGRASALAAALDTLIRRYDLLLVVSSGNLYFDQLAPQAQLFGHWPGYLRDDGHEIVDPAQAALAITVGAVAHHDAPSDSARRLEVVAAAGGSAPFTRHGPGVGKAIKPELAADGGNWVFDRQRVACVPDPRRRGAVDLKPLVPTSCSARTSVRASRRPASLM